MTRIGYAVLFALAVLSLTIGSLLAFRHLDSLARAEREAAALTNWPMDSVPAHKPFVPIAAGPAEYAKFEAEDAAWRSRFARQYTLSELRARGDGRRSARQAMEDRVYEYKRRGERARAIAELESWTRRNPRDKAAMLALARLLNESGRSNEAIARYRQLLGEQAGGRQ